MKVDLIRTPWRISCMKHVECTTHFIYRQRPESFSSLNNDKERSVRNHAWRSSIAVQNPFARNGPFQVVLWSIDSTCAFWLRIFSSRNSGTFTILARALFSKHLHDVHWISFNNTGDRPVLVRLFFSTSPHFFVICKLKVFVILARSTKSIKVFSS